MKVLCVFIPISEVTMEQHIYSEICYVDESKIQNIDDMVRELKNYLKVELMWSNEIHITNIITEESLGIKNKTSEQKKTDNCFGSNPDRSGTDG